MRVAVFGSGAFGLWTANALLERTADVRVYGFDNDPHAASASTHRLIRTVYGDRHLYPPLVVESLSEWQRLSNESREDLLVLPGVMWLFRDDEYASFATAATAAPGIDRAAYPVDELDVEDASKLHPWLSLHGISRAFFEPKAGFLRAAQCCDALLARFKGKGGQFHPVPMSRLGRTESGTLEGVVLRDGTTVEADQFVFACGAAMTALFPDIFASTRLTKQLEFFFDSKLRHDQPAVPVTVDFNGAKDMFYGLADPAGSVFKIGDDTDRGTLQQDHLEPTIEDIKIGQQLARERFPELGNAIPRVRVCKYSRREPSLHPIADRHPEWTNCWLLGGGSGHGFKFSPALGAYMARRIVGETRVIEEFSSV